MRHLRGCLLNSPSSTSGRRPAGWSAQARDFRPLRFLRLLQVQSSACRQAEYMQPSISSPLPSPPLNGVHYSNGSSSSSSSSEIGMKERHIHHLKHQQQQQQQQQHAYMVNGSASTSAIPSGPSNGAGDISLYDDFLDKIHGCPAWPAEKEAVRLSASHAHDLSHVPLADRSSGSHRRRPSWSPSRISLPRRGKTCAPSSLTRSTSGCKCQNGA